MVIVGTGCAGVELAFGARAGGWEGAITLIGDDPATPYQRPPLSKGYLLGEMSADDLCLKAVSTYDKSNIALCTGARVAAIDRKRMRVELEDGRELPYDHLALTTGGRPRPLPAAVAAGGGVTNLHYLRTLADADAIRRNLGACGRLVIVGGGYIGLEVAAAAVKSGVQVTVLQAEARVLERVTAPPVSAFYENVHRQAGVDLRTREQVESVELSPDGTKVTAVRCSSGARVAADWLVVGIGLIPNSELASEAGLVVDNGIVVNSQLRTSDENVVSAGDCACFHSDIYERPVRIESVPNALEQARKIAALLCGKPPRAPAAPWFWSNQYDLNLKIAGLSQGYDRVVIRGSMQARSFSAFYLAGNRVLAADTVNRPLDFNVAKQWVARRAQVDAARLEDESIPLDRLQDATLVDGVFPLN
ncbi:NAD(P)/FAD-dependent oxidoreductase [Pandoraea terrae]|uniref:NAD(P)/FAD-dependent oxidoreductase n=1 Tax=Pandoraea terrae TaxID=1537710 RepID=UPI0030843B0E